MRTECKLVHVADVSILAMFTVAATLTCTSTAAHAQEKAIASAKTGSSLILLTNENGKFTAGENHFCVTFQSANAKSNGDFREVTANFVLLVGRIHEKPITAHLGPTVADRSCGQINLGPQYYHPSSYYAYVHYADRNGKKGSARLFFAVK